VGTDPIAVVRGLIEAFGRGDRDAMLAPLAEDVQWGGGFADTDVPTYAPRKGRAEVAGFFEAVAREQDFHRFEPILFSAAGGEVLMLAREDFHLPPEWPARRAGRGAPLHREGRRPDRPLPELPRLGPLCGGVPRGAGAPAPTGMKAMGPGAEHGTAEIRPAPAAR